jgi:hypothetical protein
MGAIKFLCRRVSRMFLFLAMAVSTVASAQSLIVAPAAVNFDTQLVGTVSAPFVLSLRNDLGQVAPATIQGYAGLTYAPSVTQTGGTCPAAVPFVLAVGASCNISLTFAPTGPVAVSSTFDVVTDAGTITLPVTARGIINFPLPTIAPSQINFGAGPTFYPLSITITNPSAAPLDLLGWSGIRGSSGTGPQCGDYYCVTGGSCTQSFGIVLRVLGIRSPLAAGASCTMQVEVLGGVPVPQAVLVLQTGGGDVSVPVSRSPDASVANAIVASPSSVNFGNQSVGSVAEQVLTFSNPGPLVSNVFGVDFNLPNTAYVVASGGTCPRFFPFSLATGSSCTIKLSFSPTAATTIQFAAVRVRADTGNVSVDVQGAARLARPLEIRPSSATFSGSATAFDSRTFMLTNPAAVAVTVSTISVGSGYFRLSTDGTCGALPIILPPAASCTFDVNRVPGAFSGVMDLTSSNGNVSMLLNVASPAAVNLNLTTTPPGLRLRVDGQLYATPLTVQVGAGSYFTVAADAQNLGTSGYTFASWSDGATTSHDVVVSATGLNLNAVFTPTALVPKLDVDNDGMASAATDGVLVLRYLLGFRGPALTAGLPIPAGAERSGPASIVAYLDQILASLDIDGAGSARASTDGLLIYRYLAGKTGVTLFSGAPAPGPRTQSQMMMILDGMQP